MRDYNKIYTEFVNLWQFITYYEKYFYTYIRTKNVILRKQQKRLCPTV